MKNKELIKIIHQLRTTHIEMIDSKQGINNTCGLANNYEELINRITDLLKTSMKALEGLQTSPETNNLEIEYNIADVIDVAIKLLPFSEMRFIDEVLEALDKESKL